jgi:3-oxoadipate enol-lactonase
MPHLPLPTFDLRYKVEVHACRPTLVLSHSLGTDLSLWSSQAGELSKHFSVVRYDTRGQGRSSAPPGSYTIADLGGDVLGLLDALQLERVHFCGISMGGLVGQWLAIHAGERIDKLVLSNTAAKIGTLEGWNSRIETVQRLGIRAIIPAVISGWFTEPFQRESPEEIRRMEELLAANDPAGYTACCAAVRDADFRAHLGAIQARTLVVCGTKDRSTTPAEANLLAGQIAGSRLLELPAAHISNVEAAHLFTPAVRDFLLA